MLQALDSVSPGHCLPPNAAWRRIMRLRVRTPPPHDAEQPPQSPHTEMLQSSGHDGLVGHARFSARGGHARPPSCGGAMTRRSQTRVESPQLATQSVQVSHGETWQSTAQSAMAQLWLLASAAQALPP